MQRSNRKLAWRLLLAAALLVGQLGAQVHAYAHADSGSQPLDRSGVHTLACNLCFSFAPLLSAVGSSSSVLPPDQGAAVRVSGFAPCTVAPRAPLHAFRSRAPPRVP